MCLQAFLGEVATWTGIVTGTLMFASPALFARWKWRGVAGATPAFMLWTGVPFFVGCVLYNLAHPAQGVGTAALRALVIVGAILQVPSLLPTHHNFWSVSDDIKLCRSTVHSWAFPLSCAKLHVMSSAV